MFIESWRNDKTLRDLEDRIRAYSFKAVFVGSTVNPALTQRVAEDTGIKLVFLYTGSLTAPPGAADGYLGYVKYNVGAIFLGVGGHLDVTKSMSICLRRSITRKNLLG